MLSNQVPKVQRLEERFTDIEEHVLQRNGERLKSLGYKVACLLDESLSAKETYGILCLW